MRKVGFAMSTYRLAKEFQDGIEELEKTAPLAYAREYLMDGSRREQLGDDFYTHVDELQAIRKRGIGGEMRYVRAQVSVYFRDNPDKPEKTPEELLGEDVLSGDSITFGFGKDIYEIAPSLKVYELFIWLGKSELGL